MKIYFVSFSYIGGFGSVEVETKNGIRDYKDILEISQFIANMGFEKVVMLNYIELERKAEIKMEIET